MLQAIRANILSRITSQIACQASFVPVRNSQYNQHFLEPIPDKDTLNVLEATGELEELKFKPVKALVHDRTFSVFYDDLYAKFVRFTMSKRRSKACARHLMEETFIQIKVIIVLRFYLSHKVTNCDLQSSLLILFFMKLMQFEKYNEAKTPEEKAEIELDPFVIFKKAVHNCMPLLMARKVKRGGVVYQVPYPLTEKYSRFIGISWLLEVVRQRPRPRNPKFPETMAKELLAAYHNEGKVIKKKQDLHRLCEQNKAYAHYRWG